MYISFEEEARLDMFKKFQVISFLLITIFVCQCSNGGDNDLIISSGGESLTPGGEDANLTQIVPTDGYLSRQAQYLDCCSCSDGLHAQACRVAVSAGGFNEAAIEDAITKINKRNDCSDFAMNTLLRMLYLNKNNSSLSPEIKQDIEDTVLNFKYWFYEPNEDSMIFWTENHQILFHTAELLAGQLYKDEVFSNSGMRGADHIARALPLINTWLNYRAKFGFAEWHSNIYFNEDLPALVNLVDFAEDEEVSTKAAMLIDLMAFDFANNYYKGIYATTHGRTEDNKKVGEGIDHPASRDSTAEAAWILLGIGDHHPEDSSNFGAVALATSSKYALPAILEDIAADALDYNEHKERSSINVVEGPDYGLSYTSVNDLIFWWGMSAPAASAVIDGSLRIMDIYELDPALIFNEELFVDILQTFAKMRGCSLSEYCNLLRDITLGVTLETVSTYTYRTPYYQLSGAQDHHKGMNGLQEHIWQATIDSNAIVYTSCPGGISMQEFTGGWMPRAALYKNVGVIQYDRGYQLPEAELLCLLLGGKMYTHAYFPCWAFDEVTQSGKWTFGRKGDSYIALYSDRPTIWKSDYELFAFGKKNLWVVELGCKSDNGSFTKFQSDILNAMVTISEETQGYDVFYESPSQGDVTVSWDGPLKVNDNEIDIGPYLRFDNKYCQQDFGTTKTIIEFDSQRLELDFDNITRWYWR